MRAAPSFQFSFAPCAAERALLAALAGIVAAACGAWGWSHVDAAAGLAGRGAWPWVVVVAGAAALGAALGWFAAPKAGGAIAWQQGQWSLTADGSACAHAGTLEPRLDVGGWLLLRFRAQAGRTWWVTTGRRRAGAAWQPLRATLYAPGGGAGRTDARRGAST